jgi:hypothetical protein
MPVLRPAERRCVVLVAQDDGLAKQISRAFARQVKTGRLVTYHRAEQLLRCLPAESVGLAILAGPPDPAELGRTVRRLREALPRAVLAAVGTSGTEPEEQAAREGGALFFTRSIPRPHLRDLLTRAVRGTKLPATRRLARACSRPDGDD